MISGHVLLSEPMNSLAMFKATMATQRKNIIENKLHTNCPVIRQVNKAITTRPFTVFNLSCVVSVLFLHQNARDLLQFCDDYIFYQLVKVNW